jgi:hypothetical protein
MSALRYDGPSEPVELRRTGITASYNRTFATDVRELVQNALDGVRGFGSFIPRVDRRAAAVDVTLLALAQRGQQHETLLSVHCEKGVLTMQQRMPEETALPRTALLLYSAKRHASGDIGGFGEGIKLCALQLLKSGYELEYEMFKERWTFRLDDVRLGPRDGSGVAGERVRELVVQIDALPERIWSDLIITVKGADCMRLFAPERFMQIVPPRSIDFTDGKTGRCEFLSLDAEPPPDTSTGTPRATKSVYVNSVFLHNTSTVSFHVNLRLPVKDLSPDRDSLRVSEAREIDRALEQILRRHQPGQEPDEELKAAQAACYEIVERERGNPRDDLRYLTSAARLSILSHFQRLLGDPKAFPIAKNVDNSTQQLYRLAGYTPVVTESAKFFADAMDIEIELRQRLRALPRIDTERLSKDVRKDVALLQRAAVFVKEAAKTYLRVSFVKLPPGTELEEVGAGKQGAAGARAPR